MKMAEQNRLELIFVAFAAEQCGSATLALLSNQNHKNAFKFIFFKILHEKFFKNFFKLLICVLIP